MTGSGYPQGTTGPVGSPPVPLLDPVVPPPPMEPELLVDVEPRNVAGGMSQPASAALAPEKTQSQDARFTSTNVSDRRATAETSSA
jgi:hypothetical protein